MKIRTDFVTNSSSSSFIFKEYDEKKVRECIMKKMLKLTEKEKKSGYWDEWSEEYLADQAKSITALRFKEHGMHDLMEVYDWYWDDVADSILKSVSDETVEQVKEGEFSKNQRVAAMLVMKIYEELCWECRWERQEKLMVVSYERVMEKIWDLAVDSEFQGEYNGIWIYYLDHMEEINEEMKAFEGKAVGDVMEVFFDAKYLYFEGYEINHEIMEALAEAKLCSYLCVHMG